MAEINDKDYEEIKRLCKNGDILADRERFEEAILEYYKAYKIIPDPKIEWNATTWVLIAIADAFFFLHDFESVKKTLYDVLRCPGGYGNPFVHMRLGQAEFELGNKEIAKEQLGLAHEKEGDRIFRYDAPKYLNFLVGK